MAPGLVESAAPRREAQTLESLTADYDDTLRFFLNGKKVVLDDADPEMTLLEYLRSTGLTGTKMGCAEGGCGACTVVISQINPTTNKVYHASVNACISPLISVDGKHVITVEGIGSVRDPHPAQERIAMGNGSQCGFCTPGIVMVSTVGQLDLMHTNPDDFNRVCMLYYEIARVRQSTMLKRPSMGICADVQATDRFSMRHNHSARQAVRWPKQMAGPVVAWRTATAVAQSQQMARSERLHPDSKSTTPTLN